MVNGLLGSSVAAPSGAACGSWMVMVSTGTLEVFCASRPMVDGSPAAYVCWAGVQDLFTSTPRATGDSMTIVASSLLGSALEASTSAVLTISGLVPGG